MRLYRVLAQAEVGLNRCCRLVSARCEADVLLLVSSVLMEAGFYPISIEEI